MFEGRSLLIASTGGHLTQLVRMAQRWPLADDSVWVTFDSAQSRSMLRGKQVVYVPYIAPRDVRAVVHGRKVIDTELKGENFDTAVSTGAALAVAAFTSRLLARTSKHYIESVSRTNGPSLTGKIVANLRLASVYTQHPKWAGSRWRLVPGVLDEYLTSKKAAQDAPSLFITLGTIRPYRFDSLINAVLSTGMADERTVWQLGETKREDLPGRAVAYMGADDFQRSVENADVVITHAGVGSILQLLEMGVSPVIVPRDPNKLEHVDGHQYLICELLEEKRLAVIRKTDELRADDVKIAASQCTIRQNNHAR